MRILGEYTFGDMLLRYVADDQQQAGLCLIPAAIGGMVIAVTVQRIREIRSGETDDLDKY